MSRPRVHLRNETTDYDAVTTRCGRSRPALRDMFKNAHVRYTNLRTTTYEPAVTCLVCKGFTKGK